MSVTILSSGGDTEAQLLGSHLARARGGKWQLEGQSDSSPTCGCSKRFLGNGQHCTPLNLSFWLQLREGSCGPETTGFLCKETGRRKETSYLIEGICTLWRRPHWPRGRGRRGQEEEGWTAGLFSETFPAPMKSCSQPLPTR